MHRIQGDTTPNRSYPTLKRELIITKRAFSIVSTRDFFFFFFEMKNVLVQGFGSGRKSSKNVKYKRRWVGDEDVT